MQKKFQLPFEDRYSYQYSKQYYERHQRGLFKRFSNFLEQKMAYKALKLAGSPDVVLDLPCGAGRFLATILKSGAKKIIAGDKSTGMLQVIKEMMPAEVLKQLELLETTVTDIALPDKSVDCVLCMRLLHHIDTAAYRHAIYQEFKRVSRRTVCISYWVDGSYKSYRESLRAKKSGEISRCLETDKLEKELSDAGFTILGKVDMLKPILYWRTYILAV